MKLRTDRHTNRSSSRLRRAGHSRVAAQILQERLHRAQLDYYKTGWAPAGRPTRPTVELTTANAAIIAPIGSRRPLFSFDRPAVFTYVSTMR